MLFDIWGPPVGTGHPLINIMAPKRPGKQNLNDGSTLVAQSPPAEALRGGTIYTCPMHPQIEQDHPGTCPICGMALEPKTITAEPEDDSELRDMTRRFWVAVSLTLP